MRLILFFDLPMITKDEIRVYNRFRKYLIKNGYLMMQLSVYSKIFNNRDAVTNHVEILKRNVPIEGQIRIMMVTEKQYSNIAILVGGKSIQENQIGVQAFLKL